MSSSSGKQYGLITKLATKKKSSFIKKPSVFGDESSDDDASAMAAVNQSLHREAVKQIVKKQTQIEIQKALEEDPTVYEYDSIYDDMERKKKEIIVAKKSKDKDQKPKYIESLLKAAAHRKREMERRKERKVQEEREEEGLQYADKEAFVTSSYKKKMQELQEEEERERREAELDAANDVTKQKDMSGFYRHLYAQTTGSAEDPVAKKHQESTVKEEKMETTRKEKNSIEDEDVTKGKERNYRQQRGDSDSEVSDVEQSRDHREVSGHREDHDDRRRHDRNRHDSRDRPREKDRHLDEDRDSRRGDHRRDRGHDRDRDDRRNKKSRDYERDGRSKGNGGEKSYDKNREDDDRQSKHRPAEIFDQDKSAEISDHDKEQSATGDKDIRESNMGQSERKRDSEKKSGGDNKPSKFAKRSEETTVMSARERYLARKMNRDASKSHVTQEDED